MDTWSDEEYNYVCERHVTDNPEYTKNAMVQNWLEAGWELVEEPKIVSAPYSDRGKYTVIVTFKRSLNYNKSR
jgi:hypothetical protein